MRGKWLKIFGKRYQNFIAGKIKFTKSFPFQKFCVQGSIRASRSTSPLPGSSPSLLSRSAIIIVSNKTCQISNFKYHISYFKYHISNITFHISNITLCNIIFVSLLFVIPLFLCSFEGYCSNNE